MSITKSEYLFFFHINGCLRGLRILIKDFINILNFILLVYNIRCVIRIALDFHWVYMLRDVSSDPLVSLDHIDQLNGTKLTKEEMKGKIG